MKKIISMCAVVLVVVAVLSGCLRERVREPLARSNDEIYIPQSLEYLRDVNSETVADQLSRDSAFHSMSSTEINTLDQCSSQQLTKAADTTLLYRMGKARSVEVFRVLNMEHATDLGSVNKYPCTENSGLVPLRVTPRYIYWWFPLGCGPEVGEMRRPVSRDVEICEDIAMQVLVWAWSALGEHEMMAPRFSVRTESGPVNITAPDETTKAKSAVSTFFDLASRKKYLEAVSLVSDDAGMWEHDCFFDDCPPLSEQIKADQLKASCRAGTCLKTKILSGKQVSNEDYEIILQFLNADGTIYVFGPCCGATEKEMPSVDTFTYTVKKVEGKFLVTRAPLYRP